MNRFYRIFKRKGFLFFLFSVVSLQLGFYNNFWNVADQNWFDNFQRSSESLIVGRLAASEREGVFFRAGLIGRYDIFTDPFDQYCIYENEDLEVNKNVYETYDSQIAGQAFTFVFLDRVSPFPNTFNFKLFKFFSALLFSIILSLFLLWVHRKYGLLAAIIALLLFLMSHWLTVFGSNLYWVVGVLYIPFIFMLFKLDSESLGKTIPLTTKKLIWLAFLLVLVKCFFTGFELITTVLTMFVIPFVYYAISDGWKFKKFVSRLVSVSVGSAMAIFLYLLGLAFQLSFVKGSLANGFEYIIYSFSKRTSGDSSDFPEVYKDSLESTVSDVLEKYWNGTAIDFNAFIRSPWESFYRIDYGELILIFLIFSFLTLLPRTSFPATFSNLKKNKALVLTTWVSILAPLSWFIIFKGHSFIHTHTNFIAWYMPFCLLGFAATGTVISSVYIDLRNKYKALRTNLKRVIQVGLVLIGIFWFLGQAENLSQYNMLQQIQQHENLVAEEEGFRIYFFNGQLWYFKNDASEQDIKTRFYLHLVPAEKDELPVSRKQYGYDNLDFNYTDNSFPLPWWKGKSNDIIARVKLPDYKISEISTGQYAKKNIIWQTDFKFNK